MVANTRVLTVPWLEFQTEGLLKFFRFCDRATLGTADSNSVSLGFSLIAKKEQGLRPLHGLFFLQNNSYFFKDFYDRASFELQHSQAIEIGAWKVKLTHFENLNDYLPVILKKFKESFKSSTESGIEFALTSVKKEFFLDAEMPSLLEARLRAELKEISLQGPIEYLLSLDDVTDILVESFDRIWIEKAGELQKSSLQFSSPSTYRIYIENLLTEMHKTLDESIPYLDFNLSDGSRGHLIGPPLTAHGFYLSIRKVKKDFFSLNDLFNVGMFNADVQVVLKTCIKQRKNILISGATGSGKTTLIRALINECLENERIIVLEDTPELKIARENTAYLLTRAEANNSLAQISLSDLIRQSLRMRPDRIVIGEVRGGEALDLVNAMNTGHRGCLGSLHSNSSRDALFRLQGLIQMSEASLSEQVTRDLIARNIQMILHCGRASDGRRRIQEIAWIRGIDGHQILLEVMECS